MVWTRHIQIDTRHVSEVTAILVSLKKEMAPNRSQVSDHPDYDPECGGVFRLSVSAIAQVPEFRDDAGWIFEQIDAFYDQRRSKFRRIDIVGDRHRIGCRHTAYSFIENPQLVGGSL